MKTLVVLFALSSPWAFAQESSDLFEKAPPAIDEALRSRVNQFYQAFVTGKFREAFALVADDAQDAFFSSPKDQYKSCETIRIKYSEEFTKATVIESCKSDWVWHGIKTPTTFPLTSTWKRVDGQWSWYYVRPTLSPSPFSPTGYVNVDPAQPASPSPLPTSMKDVAKDILAKVKVDKTSVLLHPNESSKDELHVTNDMPGEIALSLDPVPLPGLKIAPAKTLLPAKEQTVVVFEYNLDDATITCGECAKRVHDSLTTRLHIQPTGQVFDITINFSKPKSGEIALPKK